MGGRSTSAESGRRTRVGLGVDDSHKHLRRFFFSLFSLHRSLARACAHKRKRTHAGCTRGVSPPVSAFIRVAVSMWLPVGRAQVQRARVAQPLVLAIDACARAWGFKKSYSK